MYVGDTMYRRFFYLIVLRNFLKILDDNKKTGIARLIDLYCDATFRKHFMRKIFLMAAKFLHIAE